ncbi:glycosyltransferase family 61 protein [Candidatus Babeliales bacterium]|nr:glycosyltransferase family 61 protein [Candidatus Babeliales bacterium]
MTLKSYFFFIFLLLPSVINSWWFNLISVQDLITQNPTILYQKCFDKFTFNYQTFPLSINPEIHPNQGSFLETFILKIPNGTVQSYGTVIVNNQFIQEFIWKGFVHNLNNITQLSDNQLIQVQGTIAVLNQTACQNYWHWVTETLASLALLELQNIEYDYLHIPQFSHFMEETLKLWGIKSEKIINADIYPFCTADQLIIPSLVSNISIGSVWFACYTQPHLIKYVREKLLTAALQQEPSEKLCSRVFISRKDAPQRQIINEDAVFQILEAEGFKRYTLDNLSVTDQILLFHNAEIIICPQGTGLANSIFCTEKTKIIELFQGLNDCTFWYLAQILNLNYTPIKTTNFTADYAIGWASNTYVPTTIIKKLIQDLKNEKYL